MPVECPRRKEIEKHSFNCIVDQGIYGHLTRRNLAVLAAERGDHAEVGRLWEAVLPECPGDREALARLGDSAGESPNHARAK
jgi:hypothetical protein